MPLSLGLKPAESVATHRIQHDDGLIRFDFDLAQHYHLGRSKLLVAVLVSA